MPKPSSLSTKSFLISFPCYARITHGHGQIQRWIVTAMFYLIPETTGTCKQRIWSKNAREAFSRKSPCDSQRKKACARVVCMAVLRLVLMRVSVSDILSLGNIAYINSCDTWFWGLDMRKRMTQEEFNTLYKIIWQSGPQIRYSNPNSWFNSCALWILQNLRRRDA